MLITVLACSERVLPEVMGPPQRGLVHSAFASAANLSFAHGFLLSLNASLREPEAKEAALALMPNGMLLSAYEGTFPFARLKPGMPIILGAGWLVIEALACSLDCTNCARWNPRVERPEHLDRALLRENARYLAELCQRSRPAHADDVLAYARGETLQELVERLCGRGPGLTPSGDDFLAGWMAAGWLLYGPEPQFLANCQLINEIASQRTHELSQCWLAYAAAGDFALPIGDLLRALTTRDTPSIERAAAHVLALGATSGYDLAQGIIYGFTCHVR